jgi:hypothetical protein
MREANDPDPLLIDRWDPLCRSCRQSRRICHSFVVESKHQNAATVDLVLLQYGRLSMLILLAIRKSVLKEMNLWLLENRF